MNDLGSLLAGFGFKFRSIVNLLASGYALAALLPYFGLGESGFTNLANAANGIQLTSLGEWIQSTYRSLGSGMPSTALQIVLFVWLMLVCLSLLAHYKDGAPSNLIPNSAIASAFIWALWVDLVSPRSILNLAVIAIVLTLIAIELSTAGIKNCFKAESWETSLLALIGILSSFAYILIAPPLWMAGPDQTGQTDAFERGFNAGRTMSGRRD